MSKSARWTVKVKRDNGVVEYHKLRLTHLSSVYKDYKEALSGGNLKFMYLLALEYVLRQETPGKPKIKTMDLEPSND